MSFLNEKVAASVQKTDINGHRIPLRCPATQYKSKNGTNFADRCGRLVSIIGFWTDSRGVILIQSFNLET
jgi:hypothetical protein